MRITPACRCLWCEPAEIEHHDTAAHPRSAPPNANRRRPELLRAHERCVRCIATSPTPHRCAVPPPPRASARTCRYRRMFARARGGRDRSSAVGGSRRAIFRTRIRTGTMHVANVSNATDSGLYTPPRNRISRIANHRYGPVNVHANSTVEITPAAMSGPRIHHDTRRARSCQSRMMAGMRSSGGVSVTARSY